MLHGDSRVVHTPSGWEPHGSIHSRHWHPHCTAGSQQSNMAGKRSQGIQTGKEEIKQSLFTDDLSVYVKIQQNVQKGH